MEKPFKAWVIPEGYFPAFSTDIALVMVTEESEKVLTVVTPPKGQKAIDFLKHQFKGEIEIVLGTEGLADADPNFDSTAAAKFLSEGVTADILAHQRDDAAAVLAIQRIVLSSEAKAFSFGEKQEAVRPEEEGKTEDEQPKGFIERFVLQPPGTFAPNRVLIQGDDLPQTCFLIREKSKIIRKLPRRIHLDFRGNVSVFNGVGLVVLVLRVNNRPFLTYETWLNYHSEELDHVRAMFEELSKQRELVFNWYGKSKKIEKQTHADNMLREFFRDAIEKLKPLPAWSMEEFDKAKAECFKSSPSPQQLWTTLSEAVEEREKAH